MNKNMLRVSMVITMFLVAGAITGSVIAQTDGQGTPGISYPVAELGNCTDKAACKVYCDQPANVDACLSFAEKNNLMSKEEIKVAKNFKKTGMTGPGGCKGKDECKTYCSNPDHMDECVTFAEKNGMMSSEQLDEAKKVQGAIAKGIKPPACGGKEACDAYCSSSEHVEECVKFGEAAGIISKEDAEMIRKNGGKGTGPGNGPGGQGRRGGPGGKGSDGQGPGGQGGPGPGGQGNRGPDGQSNGGPEGGGPGNGPGGQGPGDQGNGGGGKGPGGGPGGGGQGPGGQGPGGQSPGPGPGGGGDGGQGPEGGPGGGDSRR